MIIKKNLYTEIKEFGAVEYTVFQLLSVCDIHGQAEGLKPEFLAVLEIISKEIITELWNFFPCR